MCQTQNQFFQNKTESQSCSFCLEVNLTKALCWLMTAHCVSKGPATKTVVLFKLWKHFNWLGPSLSCISSSQMRLHGLTQSTRCHGFAVNHWCDLRKKKKKNPMRESRLQSTAPKSIKNVHFQQNVVGLNVSACLKER